ncbi:MAG TPA: AraC family transcriptional regulator [Chryseolinea sp.]|nr:AraC family transcriptional regulator [Chryseolinea sp.]
MKRSEVKEELRHSIGSLLTNSQTGELNSQTDFGKFYCSVETFDKFAILKRSFQTDGESLHIPFSSHEPGVQMIFSLDGYSFFNDQFDPFKIRPSSHCINYFSSYNCVNLLDEHSRQHDISFRLKKSFYADLLAQHLTSTDDGLPTMIAHEKEFNTMNQHLPADAAVLGILKNILECPFEGEMKEAYLKEHIRALFTLQLFHFNALVSGASSETDERITTRDREVLHAVKEYIDQNFLDANSLESLSRHFGLNEFKLKLGFKNLFETSPIRYLQHKRLAYALSLLRDTDKPIKEISHEIGYSHPANFSTAFVRAFGNSPQSFRSK